ncbi:hypothetical protein THAOC_04383 [Thalassiosira oceanica]|uniref:PhoD-like phosphatase metallophosphatase domain-containing protein n=1 Tax=Thalassiosira oceanica TaxID=159749 RepID=K0TJ85_THAOC|nr:hypothetical protein THAOC_04383 [Thalassiosira oceanica]|eukprot:EJK73971.1 hypothetical protein THAOC_04383 [Thalassiosira oceanica]
MRILTVATLLGASLAQDELPVTTSDVFAQSGEVSDSSVNIMARCNSESPSTMNLKLDGSTVDSATVGEDTDFTHTFVVENLASNTMYKYQVECAGDSATMTGVEASFKTAPGPDDATAVSFVWCADLAGQGYGRNPDFEIMHTDGTAMKGGYVVFETMAKLSPDFALFQGDMIYADNSIAPFKNVTNGRGGELLGTWVNNPSKDFIAVTLDEFRDNWKYNFGDEKMQKFLSETPVFVQWDDHEVTNNWWPTEVLGEPLYEEGTNADDLYAASLQALYEFNPLEADTILYRSQRFGKHLEIFFPDYRSYRDPNPENDEPDLADMMGEEQLEWLKQGLKDSTATWKIISSHDPLGVVTGGAGDRDSFGQESPDILGRELELKDLFSYIHENDIMGVVSLTSDVHFTAHVNMDPARAEGGFLEFKPLDEFVIGPIHAGSFGPNFMDTSFGAQYEFELGPLTQGYERWANLSPEFHELQSFGHASVTEEGVLNIKLVGIDGTVRFEKTLVPASMELPVTTSDVELPVTTSDVFAQSGEVSDSSINIMARCNSELPSTMNLKLDGSTVDFATVGEDTDFTHTFVVENLASNTMYKYQVECAGDSATMTGVEASFKTAPGPDDATAVSFVWCADLAGQGYGRNPDFEIMHTDGTAMKGGYVVFETMAKLSPDFALFQGDMIYADNSIAPFKNVTNGRGGELLGTWVNNPSKGK